MADYWDPQADAAEAAARRQTNMNLRSDQLRSQASGNNKKPLGASIQEPAARGGEAFTAANDDYMKKTLEDKRIGDEKYTSGVILRQGPPQVKPMLGASKKK